MSKTNEATSLKSLASGVLEKLQRNKSQLPLEHHASRPVLSAPQNRAPQKQCLFQLPLLSDEYEERLAIAEYDGLQNTTQALRISYLDAFMAVLVTLPYEDSEGDWLFHRIITAKKWLLDQEIDQPK